MLRDVQRCPHGARCKIGGYPAEVVAATGAVKGSEMDLVLRVLADQLRDLRVIANWIGCYDAADWLSKHERARRDPR